MDCLAATVRSGSLRSNQGWVLRLLACALQLALATASAQTPLTVRVDSRGSAPRWIVNGQPRRARVFFGAPGPSPITISPPAQSLTFDFVALASSTNGTLHFRFGQAPGEIFLDDIQVIDLDSQREALPRCDFEAGAASFGRDWTFWPQGAANTVGSVAVVPGAGRDGSAALRVALQAPADGRWPDFHIYHHPNLALVEGRRYRVSLWVRAAPARALTMAFYQPGDPFVFLGGPEDCFGRQIGLAAKAGVDFVSFPIDLPWPPPGRQPDWCAADLACKVVLNTNPRALLIPRVPMDPPDWWRQAFPDDVMQWENGRRDKGVVASPRYRQDAARRVAALVEHLEAGFGNHIAGYHPCGQNTGEWFYESAWEPPLSGYSPADRAAWRQWLKGRYASDEALRSAWGNPAAGCDNAPIPTPAQRHASPAGCFRDPTTERPLIDFAEFQQAMMADCVCELAHAVRAASAGRKLVLFFYGYGFEFGALPNGPAVAGHYALRRVLDCPDVDVLCSPISYFDRGLGGSAPAMSAAESVALAGKMWLAEDDTHTFLATGTQPGWTEHVNTLEDSNRELVRNLSQEACRNFATWWMDLGATGWFNDERLWTMMARMDTVDAAFLAHPTPFQPEVAAVLDERSVGLLTPEGSRIANAGIYEARAALGRLGAPYGQYLLDDVLAGRVRAKLLVFLNAWRLSAAERTQLVMATAGKTCVWCYAPGFFDGPGSSLDAAEPLTGFRLQTANAGLARAKPTAAGVRLGVRQEFGLAQTNRPLFTTAAPEEEVLAAYPDGSPAVVRRRHSGGVSFFVGPPGLASDLLRVAALDAGVHLFTRTDCNVYANGPFLALHAARAGEVAVDTGKTGEVKDALTGETVGRGPVFSLLLGRGDTRVLKY